MARGLATGLVLMGVFTLLWGWWTLQGLGTVAVLTVCAFSVLGVVFLVRGVALFTAARHAVASSDAPATQASTIGRRFGIVVGAELS